MGTETHQYVRSLGSSIYRLKNNPYKGVETNECNI